MEFPDRVHGQQTGYKYVNEQILQLKTTLNTKGHEEEKQTEFKTDKKKGIMKANVNIVIFFTNNLI